MPKIWRVENCNGDGPYQTIDDIDENERCENDITGVNLSNPLLFHSNVNGHPSPYIDKGIKRNPLPCEICGFKTKKQAYQWFSNDELNYLKESGFELKKIYVYKITAIGEKQLLVIRNYNPDYNYYFNRKD